MKSHLAEELLAPDGCGEGQSQFFLFFSGIWLLRGHPHSSGLSYMHVQIVLNRLSELGVGVRGG